MITYKCSNRKDFYSCQMILLKNKYRWEDSEVDGIYELEKLDYDNFESPYYIICENKILYFESGPFIEFEKEYNVTEFKKFIRKYKIKRL